MNYGKNLFNKPCQIFRLRNYYDANNKFFTCSRQVKHKQTIVFSQDTIDIFMLCLFEYLRR